MCENDVLPGTVLFNKSEQTLWIIQGVLRPPLLRKWEFGEDIVLSAQVFLLVGVAVEGSQSVSFNGKTERTV